MTTNVTVRVPTHVDRVLISFEKFDGTAWTPDGSQLILAGNVHTFCIHDTRRVCSMQELQVDPASHVAPLERLNTINEHAHGDDAHQAHYNPHHRSHGGLSDG